MSSYRPIESSDEHDEAERTRPSTDEARLLPTSAAPPSSREPPAAAGRTPSSRYVQIPLSEDDDDDEEEEGDDNNEERPHNGRPETSSLPSYSVSHDRDRDRGQQQQQQQQQQIRNSSPATLHVSAAEGAGSTASSSSSGPSTPHRPADRRPPLSPRPQPRDGVFANLSAKPAPHATEEHKEEDDEDVPPPYETAAGDPTPSYFDTTVITAGTMDDEILVEGLPVGSGFVFVWNMLVSMSFQFVGFLLTYLLHTSHAGKNGSRAGLGITLIQYGFYLRSRTAQDDMYGYYSSGQGNMSEKSQEEVSSRAELLSYVVMVLGWFITIRSTSEYIRARKLQAVITYHPENVIV